MTWTFPRYDFHKFLHATLPTRIPQLQDGRIANMVLSRSVYIILLLGKPISWSFSSNLLDLTFVFGQ